MLCQSDSQEAIIDSLLSHKGQYMHLVLRRLQHHVSYKLAIAARAIVVVDDHSRRLFFRHLTRIRVESHLRMPTRGIIIRKLILNKRRRACPGVKTPLEVRQIWGLFQSRNVFAVRAATRFRSCYNDDILFQITMTSSVFGTSCTTRQAS